GAKTNYTQSATIGDTKVWNVGAHLDFGWTRFSAGYYEDKVERTVGVKATGFLLGAVIPLRNDQIKVSYSSYGTDEAGDPTARKLAIGYVYAISKRTSAYATYAHVDNKG